MATFAEIMASQPSALNPTVSTLMASAQTLGSGWSLYQSVSSLQNSWGGSTQQAQAGQAGNLFSSGQQVLTSITQTQTIINAGAQQLQTAKAQLKVIVAEATAKGFVVLPTGQVVPSGAQLAACTGPHAAAMVAALKAAAAGYTARIEAVVFQTTAADVQVALSLAKAAVDIVAALTKKNSTTPAATTVPTTTPTTAPMTGYPTTGGTAIGTGSSLAGAGSLHGAYGVGADGLGLAGAGMSGASTGIAMGPGGVTGMGPGLAGAGRPGMGTGSAGGRGASSGASVVGGGSGHGGSATSDDEHESQGWLLVEDDDTFASGDIPDTSDGVLS